MEAHKLGPNGGLVYCMEYLQANLHWLEEQLLALDTHYVIFDCPGQVELYTHHTGFKTILDTITKDLNCRLCSVHLVDAFYCWYKLILFVKCPHTLCTYQLLPCPCIAFHGVHTTYVSYIVYFLISVSPLRLFRQCFWSRLLCSDSACLT